jgi:hypothetical protein
LTVEGEKGFQGQYRGGVFCRFLNDIWWRCRDLNPGHCGYEPHALTT